MEITNNKYNNGITFENAIKYSNTITVKSVNVKNVYLKVAVKNKIKLNFSGMAVITSINKNTITLIPPYKNNTKFPSIQNKLILDLPYNNIDKSSVILSYDSYQPLSFKDKVGFYAQYFTVGIVYGGLPSTIYGFFLGYLNVPAYVYASASVITTLPWSFKFIFGIMNDCLPIFGYKRKSYMILGWIICFIFLIVLACQKLPEPYYCIGEDGYFIKNIEPCNPEATKSGGIFVGLMMCIALGYVIADVAADGLMVEYAKKEEISKRGRVQTNIYFVRTIGIIFSTILVGFGMNGKQYNGTFDNSLSFNTIIGIFAIPVGCMVPITYYFISEEKTDSINPRNYLNICFNLLKNKAFFYILLYQFFGPFISGISTPSGGLVKQEWAGVKNLQNQSASIISLVIFAFGLQMIKRYYLNYSWRKMLAFTLIILNLTDMICSFITIFDIFRNQYFYLGETILDEIPAAFNFIVSTFIIVEMADDGNEGMVYGLLTTVSNLGSPFSRAVGNGIFALFKYNLSDNENYLQDSPKFRNQVALSFGLSYLFSFISLVFLLLIPDQKIEAQKRKREWNSKNCYAYVSIILVIIAFLYAVTINLLTIFPNTVCLKIVGGQGC